MVHSSNLKEKDNNVMNDDNKKTGQRTTN